MSRDNSNGNGGTNVLAGVLAGVAGGLVASWMMNVFIENVGPTLQEAVDSHPSTASKQPQRNDDAPKEDATMKAADAVVSTLTGGRHLSFEAKKKGGPVVHYAFGAIMGGVYGALAEALPEATGGFGTVFGSALFLGADVLAVPALHLSAPATETPVSSLASPYGAHLVYGMTTEAVRRIVRAVF